MNSGTETDHDMHDIGTNMLGIYSLEGDVPVGPEIVLANCKDPAMLGQMLSVFENSDHVRFFLASNIDEETLELGNNLHFVKDHGNWVLAMGDDYVEVLFNDNNFNSTGNHGSFEIVPGEDGTSALKINDPAHIIDDSNVFLSDDTLPLLINETTDELMLASSSDDENGPHTIHIAQSALAETGNEHVVENFSVGDTLELKDGLTIKDITWDTNEDQTDYTLILVGDDDGNHAAVKLLGVSQADLSAHQTDVDVGTTTDDLIQHMIDSAQDFS
ncbi:MAG: hypothetical protein JEY79_17145 [Pseudodesulfovibrio sp.]|nr:hypothetical protein [Pseudodesulfovibrio sp.]